MWLEFFHGTTVQRFGDSVDIFLNDIAYQLAVARAVEEIGELTNHFSEDFFSKHQIQIPFKQIIDLRNRIAHGYHTIDFNILWEILKKDISVLEAFCKEKLKDSELQTVQEPTPSSPKFRA
jgi:uncharacterized protein with HEPN domain